MPPAGRASNRAGTAPPCSHPAWTRSAFHWSDQTGAWKAVLIAKIVVVAAAGVGSLLHSRATSRPALALWGSVAGLASVAALVMGVLLAG